jgi:hypothetical protein
MIKPLEKTAKKPVETTPVKPAKVEIQKPAKADDQKAFKAGDQNTIPTQSVQTSVHESTKPKTKKLSEQTKKWKNTPAFELTQVITKVAKDNPKSRNAAVKFALYEEGMTVGAYIEKSHKAGTTKAMAMADVRWDHAAGFITVK